MKKIELLNQIAIETANCQKCVLHKERTQIVFGKGNPDAVLAFVGEAPGYNEDQKGIPFVGRAGQLLDTMIKAMGFATEEVYICNINKCRPPGNRKPLPEEMECCKPFLVKQLDIVTPKVIVALGATAVEGLLGTGIGITKRRGNWGVYNGIPVMPTYHPSFCLRNPKMKIPVWEDLQKVMKFIEN